MKSSAPESPRCLVVFKFSTTITHHLIRKLSLVYDVDWVFAREIIYENGSTGLIRYLNKLIGDRGIETIFLEIDFFPAFDYKLIEALSNSAIKVLITLDDLLFHELNSINAAACDLVLSADPVSVLKYREKALQAHYLALEANPGVYYDRAVSRDLDVLFFGSLKRADRRAYVDFLKERGIRVEALGGEGKFVTEDVLAQHISRSKIVVNFSKTDYLHHAELPTEHAFPSYLQFKGRVIESGLCRTPCVSEYSPALELLFSEDEVPTFRSKEECYRQISRLLLNDQARTELADRLYAKLKATFSDDVQAHQIRSLVASAGKSKFRGLRIPRRYLRAVLKSRMAMLGRRPGVALRELIGFVLQYPEVRVAVRIVTLVEVLIWIPSMACRKLMGTSGRFMSGD